MVSDSQPPDVRRCHSSVRNFLLLLLFLAARNAACQDLATLTTRLETLQEALAIPGMSAAVVKDGRILWSRGFGFADVAHHVPATQHTLYPIASLTKPVAATLFLKLLEQGKVSLDDPLKKYVPRDFQTERVHVRHIMTHTAAAFTPGSAPGDAYMYSGSFYGYLTFVIANGSGMGFRRFLIDSLLEPTGMTESVPGHDVFASLASADSVSTALQNRYSTSLTRLAIPYLLVGDDNLVAPYPPTGVNSAAGLFSTVTDLAKFDAALDRHSLISEQSQELAWTNQPTNSGVMIPYGLGWFVQQVNTEKVVWHYGQWPMFSALYVKVPAKRLTFILLANSTGLSAPFDLDRGELLASPFALAFLRAVVGESIATDRDDEATRAIRAFRDSRRERPKS